MGDVLRHYLGAPFSEKTQEDAGLLGQTTSSIGRVLRQRSWPRLVTYLVFGCLGALVVVLCFPAPRSALHRPLMHHYSKLIHSNKLVEVSEESHAAFSRIQNRSAPAVYERPHDVPIYGLVFYGRAINLQILDCYLRRNLAVNGGWLDEVHFVQNTRVPSDLSWLHDLVQRVPQYKILTHPYKDQDFNQIWRHVVQAGVIHVKIDDDMVFVSDKAVEEVVTTLVARPDAFAVLANLINSAMLGWVHHHSGAIKAYMPEPFAPPKETSAAYGPTAWRASALPTLPSADYDFREFDLLLDQKGILGAKTGEVGGAPFANHRWLPCRNGELQMAKTPMWHTQYSATSNDWRRWALGAQQHYAFLDNLETKNLDAYHMGNPRDGTWNMRHMHSNVNFMAIWGHDILDHLPANAPANDEAMLTEIVPAALKREVLTQSRAIASHFAFGPQSQMSDTDLLSRYRAYANAFVCSADNHIPIPAGLFPQRDSVTEASNQQHRKAA